MSGELVLAEGDWRGEVQDGRRTWGFVGKGGGRMAFLVSGLLLGVKW